MSYQRIVTLPPIPDRPKGGHKGIFGRVLVVGGSATMVGAPVFAGTAALRMGAGLVQVAMPRSVLAAGLSITPELIGLLSDAGAIRALVKEAEKADAIVIGPGLGQLPAAKTILTKLIAMDVAMVIDADGLNLLAAGKTWPKKFKPHAVLTPHPGEMKRLAKLLNRREVPADDDGRIEIATLAAKKFKQVVVLKGDRTIVTDGQRVYMNRTGDSTLSKAGSGDILSGIIGTFLAQKMDHFDAACAAVWIHGKAGEITGESLGRRSALARDVIDHLPTAIAEYLNNAGSMEPPNSQIPPESIINP